MTSPGLVLVAASGLAREVAETVALTGSHQLIGMLDDDAALHGRVVVGLPVLGGIEEIEHLGSAQIAVCAGHGADRRELVGRLSEAGVLPRRFARIIHPSVHLSESCVVGTGSIILANTVLTAEVRVGRHVVIMPNTTLTHDDEVSDYATLCAGVSLAGRVVVDEGAYLGTNSCVRENVYIGPDAVLGMGAALLEDLPAKETWYGVPARRRVDR